MRVFGESADRAVEIEGDAEVRHVGGWNQAADDALAVVGLQPVDLARRARQMFPDRQQQAGHEMELARACGRNFGKFLEPGAVNSSSVAICQWLAASLVLATASRDSGRIRRTRSSTLPSSSVRLDAGAAARRGRSSY